MNINLGLIWKNRILALFSFTPGTESSVCEADQRVCKECLRRDGDVLSLSLSLSLSRVACPWLPASSEEFQLSDYFHISVLRVPFASNMCMPLALETVLRTLSESCQLTSWDIRGKGKMTTLIVRFNEDTGAIEDQHEPVRSVTRYRKKSPSELRRDAKRVKARQQEQASKQDSEQQTSLSSSNDGLEASNTGRSVSPASQYHAHPLDASHRAEELEDGEHNGSVDNSDHREDDRATQEQCCDAAETMAAPEDIQQFWDDQSDGIKYYLSTLAPEHVSTVVSSAARPVVKKIVMDQRDGKNSFYAMTDGAVFEYDRDKCSVTDWFPLGIKGKKTKLIYDNVERWPEVDHLRYPQQIHNMKLHIGACCCVIQRHGPTFSGKSDPQTNDQRNN